MLFVNANCFIVDSFFDQCTATGDVIEKHLALTEALGEVNKVVVVVVVI